MLETNFDLALVANAMHSTTVFVPYIQPDDAIKWGSNIAEIENGKKEIKIHHDNNFSR